MITFLKHAQKLAKTPDAKSRPVLQNVHTNEGGTTVATDSRRIYTIKADQAQGLLPLVPSASEGNYPNTDRLLTPMTDIENDMPNVYLEQLNLLAKWLAFAKASKATVKADVSPDGSLEFSLVNATIQSTVTLTQEAQDETTISHFDASYLYDLINYIKDYKTDAVLKVSENKIAVVANTPQKPSAFLLGKRVK